VKYLTHTLQLERPVLLFAAIVLFLRASPIRLNRFTSTSPGRPRETTRESAAALEEG
jgi:hypothetical protein